MEMRDFPCIALGTCCSNCSVQFYPIQWVISMFSYVIQNKIENIRVHTAGKVLFREIFVCFIYEYVCVC